LLLYPEAIEWSQPITNKPPRVFPVVQRRVCFTDLNPAELLEHATKFGHFAIEFEMDSARQLGAIPVFYVPQRDGGVGPSLVAILLDAYAIIGRAEAIHELLKEEIPGNERRTVSIGFARSTLDTKAFSLHREESRELLDALNHEATPWRMLSIGMGALANFFYPADNTIMDGPLQYYQQREWRIACNFAIDGVNVLRDITEGEAHRISQIDEQFFLRPIQTDFGPIAGLSASLIHPGVGNKTILQMARRLIVPGSAVEQSHALIEGVEGAPEVISIEELS
jgi:hypothetical protein